MHIFWKQRRYILSTSSLSPREHILDQSDAPVQDFESWGIIRKTNASQEYRDSAATR